MGLEGCEQQSSNELKIINIQPGTTNTKSLDPEALQAKELGEKENSEVSFASPTPEKPEWNSKGKDISSLARKQLSEHFHNEALLEKAACSHSISEIDEEVEMPEKYKILCDLFNRIETSTRLLGLRKLLPTFRNICKQVDILSKRKLLYRHLAQMIYIFPEAFKIEKILIHNQATLLMVPDIKITLLKDVLDHAHSHQSNSMALSSAFHARLLDFVATCPEGADVPEAALPDPFNQRDNISHEKVLPEECIQLPPRTQVRESMSHEEVLAEECNQPPPDNLTYEPISSGFHLPKSFKRHFSVKSLAGEDQRTQLLVTQESLDSMKSNDKNDENRTPQKLSNTSSALRSTMVRHNPPHNLTSPQCPESTPVKADSSLGQLFTYTPAQQTPKRAVPSTQEKMSIDGEEPSTEERLTTSARRSLIYSPTSSKESMLHQDVDMIQMRNAVEYSSDHIVSAKRSLWEDATKESSSASLDVVSSGQINSLNQLGDCSETHACLLETFDAICLISHSTKNLLLTKEELVHKILSANLEIEETRVAEDHLELLEQLLPDWIHKQALSNGQFTYSIKNLSDREACRAKLVESS